MKGKKMKRVKRRKSLWRWRNEGKSCHLRRKLLDE